MLKWHRKRLIEDDIVAEGVGICLQERRVASTKAQKEDRVHIIVGWFTILFAPINLRWVDGYSADEEPRGFIGDVPVKKH